MRPVGDQAAFLAGFVVAEGCFTRYSGRRFGFAIALGSADGDFCRDLPGLFGVGMVQTHTRRQEHYQDEVTYAVRALPDLVEVIVPFMDDHLPPSHKRVQYRGWRANLLEYWETKARRVKQCIVADCPEPRRAKCLCRRHYYEQYGQ